MQSTRITLIVSTALFFAMLGVRLSSWFGELSGHGRYYLAAMLGISGIIVLITLFRLIRPNGNRSVSGKSPNSQSKPQRRDYFRLPFDHPPQPRFIETDDSDQAAAFNCPVWDVSETGISLLCSGVYEKGAVVSGEIVLPSGRTAPINGVVLRDDGRRTSLYLHCTIDPPLLMAEQRERIVQEKSPGPRPAVSNALLDTSPRSLPSHAPKGICRLKRR
jgi:hypothetical protein